MQVIDFLILGFVELKIDPSDFSRIASFFLRCGIKMRSKDFGTIRVFYHQKNDAIKVLEDLEVNYNVSREFRLISGRYDAGKSIAIATALIFTIATVVFLSDLVWCIEVDGNTAISDAAIISRLEECGFYIGSMWSKIDFGKIESSFLDGHDGIGWININRSGTVAYVSVIESDNITPSKENEFEFSNIVANEDCVIEYIRVTKGVAVVKVGDAVTKGDTLIVGINQGEGGGFCAAEGVVVGRVNKRITATVTRERTRKNILNTTLHSLKIKIFNFSINIFKKYRNLGIDCDIIEETNKITLSNGRKLPLEIVKEYEIQYAIDYFDVNDDDLVREAQYKMNSLLQQELIDVNLNSIRTYGNFTNEGYEMTSEVIYSCDVSESVEFTVD